MLHQTFDLADLPRVLFLIFIELALSADNAIVLGLLIHRLPSQLHKKALIIGSLSAFFFRAAAILGVGWLLRYVWMQFFGGVYLIYLSVSHFCKKKSDSSLFQSKELSFWKTVLLIELLDLSFAIDSILAGIAFISPAPASTEFEAKLWIVYAGGMIGLLGIRYAAHWFSGLISRCPRLEMSAFVLIAWIGLKLCYKGLSPWLSHAPSFEPLFWVVLAAILALGFVRRPKKS